MGDFSVKFRSDGGEYIGWLNSTNALSDGNIVWSEAPSYNPVIMDYFYTQWDSESGVANWNQHFKNAMTKGTFQTCGGLCVHLVNMGATSAANALDLYCLPLVDNTGSIVADIELALRAYAYINPVDPDSFIINYTLATRSKVGSSYVYTNITNDQWIEHSSTVMDFGFFGGTITKNANNYYVFGMAFLDSIYRVACFGWSNDYENLKNIIGGVPEGEEFDPDFGPASEPGGYGPGGGPGGSGGPGPTFDGVSDPWVETPTKPGVLTFGLLNIYKCDSGSLNLLGETLFPTIVKPPAPPQSGVTDWVKWSGEVAEWIGNIIFAVSDSIWNKDLIDYIVSVHLIPVDVTGGNLTDIKVGPRTLTGILARPITADVIEFDCGSVHVDEYYTNYVDYMTRARVYIPFYGMVTIKAEYWQSADISLKYLWNIMDGSFIAKLYSTVNRHQSPCTTMIGQYSGCACVHMPLSGANYSSMFSQLTGAAAGVAMGAASGNVAVTASSAMALPGAMGSGGDMQQSNAYNASSAFYGHSRPFLIIERPISHFSTKYAMEQGLPLIVSQRIGSCSGLTICENPILNFACSDEEAKEIIAALKEGVIV